MAGLSNENDKEAMAQGRGVGEATPPGSSSVLRSTPPGACFALAGSFPPRNPGDRAGHPAGRHSGLLRSHFCSPAHENTLRTPSTHTSLRSGHPETGSI